MILYPVKLLEANKRIPPPESMKVAKKLGSWLRNLIK